MNPDSNYDSFNPNPVVIRSPLQEMLPRLLAIVGIAAVFLLIMWLTWSQKINKHSVTFRARAGTVIQIGTQRTDDNQGIQTILGDSSKQNSIRLKPGAYRILYGGKDYEPQYKSITLDSDIILTTPDDLRYNSAKLSSLLNQERSTIRANMATAVNMSVYTPQSEHLLYDGTWYIAQLEPSDTYTYDRLVIVMHKQNGTWQVAAGPKMSLYKGDYPQIPLEILRTINNIPWGTSEWAQP